MLKEISFEERHEKDARNREETESLCCNVTELDKKIIKKNKKFFNNLAKIATFSCTCNKWMVINRFFGAHKNNEAKHSSYSSSHGVEKS